MWFGQDPAAFGQVLGNQLRQTADLPRDQIASRFRTLCEERSIPLNEKLYCYLMEPISEQDSLSVVYRGNYKLHFMNRIDDKQCEALFEALLDHAKEISHIDLSYNHITAESMPVLAAFVQSAVNLESLNL